MWMVRAAAVQLALLPQRFFVPVPAFTTAPVWNIDDPYYTFTIAGSAHMLREGFMRVDAILGARHQA